MLECPVAVGCPQRQSPASSSTCSNHARRGADYPFAHRTPSAAEIVKFGFTKTVATEGGKGKSKGDKAKLPCFNYAKGTCKHGNDCML